MPIIGPGPTNAFARPPAALAARRRGRKPPRKQCHPRGGHKDPQKQRLAPQIRGLGTKRLFLNPIKFPLFVFHLWMGKEPLRGRPIFAYGGAPPRVEDLSNEALAVTTPPNRTEPPLWRSGLRMNVIRLESNTPPRPVPRFRTKRTGCLLRPRFVPIQGRRAFWPTGYHEAHPMSTLTSRVTLTLTEWFSATLKPVFPISGYLTERPSPPQTLVAKINKKHACQLRLVQSIFKVAPCPLWRTRGPLTDLICPRRTRPRHQRASEQGEGPPRSPSAPAPVGRRSVWSAGSEVLARGGRTKPPRVKGGPNWVPRAGQQRPTRLRDEQGPRGEIDWGAQGGSTPPPPTDPAHAPPVAHVGRAGTPRPSKRGGAAARRVPNVLFTFERAR